MFRKIAAAAVLGIAPLIAAAVPASALTPGQTVCYAADGTATLNPTNPDDFDYCVTRDSSGGSGGSGGPQLCTADGYSYGYNDGLGSTGPYTVKKCTPIAPLQG